MLIGFVFGIACMLGALGRHLSDVLMPARGILWVNVIGSLIAGLVIGASNAIPDVAPAIPHILVAGFAGSLTTFSTVSVTSATHAQQREWKATILTWVAHLGLGILAGLCGFVSIMLMVK